MDVKGDTADRAAAETAARQHGVISTTQLRALGVSRDAVRRRVESGRLHRVHWGVYAVGYPRLTHAGRCMAAALSYGPDAVVSHRSAAELWGLLRPTGGQIQVSVSGISGRRRRRGIHIHRSRTLAPESMTIHRGVPVTTPKRTIADLRSARRTRSCPAAIPARELRRAIRQASVLGLEIGPSEDVDGTRSELERLFLRICRRHGLAMPEVNVRIDSFLVDFLWRERRLIVETDGYRFHSGREAFEDDRERDLRLKSLGYEVIRLTYRQIASEAERIADTLRALLTR